MDIKPYTGEIDTESQDFQQDRAEIQGVVDVLLKDIYAKNYEDLQKRLDDTLDLVEVWLEGHRAADEAKDYVSALKKTLAEVKAPKVKSLDTRMRELSRKADTIQLENSLGFVSKVVARESEPSSSDLMQAYTMELMQAIEQSLELNIDISRHVEGMKKSLLAKSIEMLKKQKLAGNAIEYLSYSRILAQTEDLFLSNSLGRVIFDIYMADSEKYVSKAKGYASDIETILDSIRAEKGSEDYYDAVMGRCSTTAEFMARDIAKAKYFSSKTGSAGHAKIKIKINAIHYRIVEAVADINLANLVALAYKAETFNKMITCEEGFENGALSWIAGEDGNLGRALYDEDFRFAALKNDMLYLVEHLKGKKRKKISSKLVQLAPCPQVYIAMALEEFNRIQDGFQKQDLVCLPSSLFWLNSAIDRVDADVKGEIMQHLAMVSTGYSVNLLKY